MSFLIWVVNIVVLQLWNASRLIDRLNEGHLWHSNTIAMFCSPRASKMHKILLTSIDESDLWKHCFDSIRSVRSVISNPVTERQHFAAFERTTYHCLNEGRFWHSTTTATFFSPRTSKMHKLLHCLLDKSDTLKHFFDSVRTCYIESG